MLPIYWTLLFYPGGVWAPEAVADCPLIDVLTFILGIFFDSYGTFGLRSLVPAVLLLELSVVPRVARVDFPLAILSACWI